MPEQRERMWALFDEAAQLPPQDRAAFLDTACQGDASLRAEVEGLLAHDAGSSVGPADDSFLKSPLVRSPKEEGGTGREEERTTAPSDLSSRLPSSAFELPSHVGRYRILRRLGEGGMGTVYEAEQDNPRRTVALKVIRPGLVSADLLKRFSHEAQILGRLHHPGIAQIYEAGLAADGRPFFAMEFVRGSPLDEYVRNHAVAVAARLHLLAQVCDAVQHAHDKGVVHRDLKPANILVDEAGQPKVLDFGIARVTDADLRTTTARTETGQLIGTLSYMSPEQVAADPAALDRRSDVYTLGVILFELLADRLPYHLDHLPLPEVARVIHDQEPSRLGSINTLYRGDVETIVAKALEKDKTRRYASAGELAADLRRHLKREPILARPTGFMERGWKWTRRNPVPAALLAAVAVLLVSGTAVSSALAVWAVRGWDQADLNARDLGLSLDRETAEKQRAEEKEKTANAREAETRAVLDFVETRVFAAARPKGEAGGLGRNVELRQAVEVALPFVDKSFTDQPLIEARLRMTVGTSFWYLDDVKLAAAQHEKAHALFTEHLGPDHLDTLRSKHTLSGSYYALGRRADALQLSEETLALRRAKLGPDHTETLQSMMAVAFGYSAFGRHDDALKLRKETLALQKDKLGPDHPLTLMSMSNLANSYGMLGRHADALKLHEEALALRKAKLGRDHPETLRSMHNLSASYNGVGRHVDALKLREETLALQEDRVGPDHSDTLKTLMGVAESLVKLDRGAEAVPLLDECLLRSAGKAVDPRLVPGVMELRLRHFEKAGDAAGCRATAEIWEKLNRADAESLYRAACLRAVTAAVLRSTNPSEAAAKDAAAEEDRALAWLKQAVAAGYKDRARLATDKDLDALRNREDFKKLLAEPQGKER